MKNAVFVEAHTGQTIFGHTPAADKIALGKTVFIRPVPIISSILAKPHIERFENRVPHMYRDSVGKVTVGIGHLVIDLADAQSLPFVRRGTNVRATLSEIANDHASVSAQPANQHFSTYEPHTNLDLPQSEIDRLYERDFQIHLAVAKNFFPLHRLPRIAQVGVVDLAYQTGGTNIRPYINFKAALFRRDWARAGAEAAVKHPVVTKDRNDGRLNLFMSLKNRELFFIVGPNAQRGLRLTSVLLKL